VRIARLLALFAASAPAVAQPPAEEPFDPARFIVQTSARVQEGEIVLIRGHQRDTTLLEDLAIRCRAAGAFPLLQYTSDRLHQGMVEQADPKFDNQLNALDVRLASVVNCVISLEAPDYPSLLNHVPGERLAARAKADAAAADLMRRAGVRTVIIGNGIEPTPAAANQYALSQEDLSRIFWEAVAVEPEQFASVGSVLRSVLAEGKELKITNPNGTSVKMKIAGARVTVADGAVAAEDVRAIPGAQVRLPAGELLLIPVPGSAEGRIVVDTLWFRGRTVSGLSVNVKAGKATGLSARSGVEVIREVYDATGPGKDVLSYLSLGLNPAIRQPAGTKFNAPMPRGMVTLYLGNNTRARGENAVPLELPLYLPGSTLEVDATTLIDAGRLIMPTSPLPEEPPSAEEMGPPAPTDAPSPSPK
jgi:aminopeptidase